MDERIVLVVDDDAAIRSLITELLDEAGYTVLEADCGRQALRLADERLPAVVLVDHRLPDMSGLDVIDQLRARPAARDIPVIVLTGEAHRLTDADHGANRVLPKPFDIMVLLEQVNAVTSDARDGAA